MLTRNIRFRLWVVVGLVLTVVLTIGVLTYSHKYTFERGKVVVVLHAGEMLLNKEEGVRLQASSSEFFQLRERSGTIPSIESVKVSTVLFRADPQMFPQGQWSLKAGDAVTMELSSVQGGTVEIVSNPDAFWWKVLLIVIAFFFYVLLGRMFLISF